MGQINTNGAPLVGSVSIAQLKLSEDHNENLDTHFFNREDNGMEWTWECRSNEGELENRAKAGDLFDLLVHFLEVTKLSAYLAIVIKTSDNGADTSGSICTSDVLRLIALCVLETKILNVIVDGESHAAPRFVRWGPVRDENDERMPAIYIPLIPAELFVESSEPLISNVAMTDWHDAPMHWHLWETIYKSGNNYMLFQSELGHEDQMFHATSADGIPLELLKHVVSFEIPTDGPDHHPFDKWGQLLILDRGRELLP
jgi:hypothetical protein